MGQGRTKRRNGRLRAVGPALQVIISPLEEQLQALAAKGMSLPEPVSGMALIDTGAASTCFDASAASQAGLAIVGTTTLSSATHTNEEVPVFAGRLLIQMAGFTLNAEHAAGANLVSQGLIALIGRDILSRCTLFYNGVDGSYSLSI